MEPLLLVIFVAIAGTAAFVSYHLKRRRREALAAVAGRLGLEFSPEDMLGCLDLPFALFQRGDGRGTENVLWGTWQDIPVRELDYWYYEESTDSKGHRTKSYYRFSCAVTEIEAACSPISLARETILTRVADAVGLDDIAFETEEFNRAFNVKSSDRKFAFDLVDQRMMRWLLGTSPEFRFEAAGPWLLCFGKKRRPAELIPLIGTLKQFRDHVPRVVSDLYPRRSVG